MAVTITQDIENIEALFDSLSIRVQAELQEQYDCKKINGPTYADVWSKLMGQVISQSVANIMKETATDRLLKLQEIENKKATEALTKRQEIGFDDNLRQKLYDAQMNAWALMFSSGLLSDKPEHISDLRVGGLANDIQNSIGTGSVDPLGPWTRELSAIAFDTAGSTIVSWGTVANATQYTLYVNGPLGSVNGYPKTVTANSTDALSVTVPATGEAVSYDLRIVAFEATGKFSKESTYSLVIVGP